MNTLKAIIIFLILCNVSFAQYKLIPESSGFTNITDIEFNQGKMFVTEQHGKIFVDNNLFMNLPVSTSGGGGVMSIAFHPLYVINHYFYVNYDILINDTINSRCSRFTAIGDSGLLSSELILYQLPFPFPGHTGDDLHFGNDGYLYISIGDNSTDNNNDSNRGHLAQDLSVLYGKVLRINVNETSPGLNYSIPVSNPFYNNLNGYRQEIYAYGFRNPFKFTFDNNVLWLGDVGESSWEEIDNVVLGGNYGWNRMEGNHCFGYPIVFCDTAGHNFIRPVYEYSHSQGRSITGGYVYRASRLPELTGKYIYGDFITGKIWSYNIINQLLLDTNINISTFGMNESELFVADYSGGNIYKLRWNILGDCNRDNKVNNIDFNLVYEDAKIFKDSCLNTDLNEDCFIDGSDLRILDNINP